LYESDVLIKLKERNAKYFNLIKTTRIKEAEIRRKKQEKQLRDVQGYLDPEKTSLHVCKNGNIKYTDANPAPKTSKFGKTQDVFLHNKDAINLFCNESIEDLINEISLTSPYGLSALPYITRSKSYRIMRLKSINEAVKRRKDYDM